MDSLANATVELEDVLGSEGRLLVDRLRDASSWPERFHLLDEFLGRRFAEAAPPRADVVRAWHRLRTSRGRIEIAALARELGCSRRHLAAQFRSQIGQPPKTVARILRFDHAMLRVGRKPELSWAELATACGYYDQAHFNRELRELAGTTPTELLAARNAGSGALAA
jgi:AraC-like DNA-binding protein